MRLRQKEEMISFFFKRSDRVFHEKLEKNEAWEIYERKLSYLREKSDEY